VVRYSTANVLEIYDFIVQLAGERIHKAGEHLAKLQAKWLIITQDLFALHFLA